MSESTTRRAHVGRTRGGKVPETVYRPRPDRSRDYPRPIPSAATFAGADRLAQTSNFFGSLVKDLDAGLRDWAANERHKWNENRKEENIRLGMEAMRIAYDDPVGVAEALRGGPAALAAMSTLPGIDANRPEFLTNLKLAHGNNMATIDFQEKFLPKLLNMDYMTGNPRKLRDEFADEQMLGADPEFEYAYRAQLAQLSDRQINTWLADQRGFLLSRQVDTEVDTLRARIITGENIGLEDIQETIGKVISVAPSSEAKQGSRDRVLFEVFRLAQEQGEGSLMQSLSRPDPETGLSLADLHRDLWEQALVKSQAAWTRTNSLDASKHLSNIGFAMSALEAGAPSVIDTPMGPQVQDAHWILTELQRHRNDHGNSADWERTYNHAIGLVGKEINNQANYANFSTAIETTATSPTGSAPFISTKTMDEYGIQWVEAYTRTRLEAGDNPEEVIGSLARAAAVYGGFGKEYNTATEHTFLHGVPDQQLQVFQFLQAVEDSGRLPGAASGILTDAMARSKFDFLNTSVKKAGANPAQVLEQFQKAAEVTQTTDWRAYARQAVPSKDLDEWIEDIADDVSGDLNGRSTQVLINNIRDEVSRQIYVSAGDGSAPLDKRKLISEAVRTNVLSRSETSYDPVSERITVTQRVTPDVVVLTDGSVIRQDPITKDTQRIAARNFNRDITSKFGEVFGNLVGLSPGPESRMGYGAAVVVENEIGVQGPLVFELGEIPVDPSDAFPFDLPEGVTRTATGLVISNVDKPIRLGEFQIAKHPTIPGHAGVYYVGPVPKTQAEFDAEAMQRLEAKAAEQTEGVRPSFLKKLETILTAPLPMIVEGVDKALPEKQEGGPTFAEQVQRNINEPSAWPDQPVARGVEVDVSKIEKEEGDTPLPGVRVEVKKGPELPAEPAAEPAADVVSETPATPTAAQTTDEISQNFQTLAEGAKSFVKRIYEKYAKAPAQFISEAVEEKAGQLDLEDLGASYVELAEEKTKSGAAWVAGVSKEHAESRGILGKAVDTASKWTTQFNDWLSSATKSGHIEGDTATQAAKLQPETADEFAMAVAKVYKDGLTRGDEWTGHADPKFIQRASELIYKEEGWSAKSYQDGRTRSIGYGFNLKRKDFRTILENLGYNYKDIWSGKQKITREHADMMRDYETTRLADLIKKQAAGTALETHQVMALISYSYNLGEGSLRALMPMIKEENWVGVANYMKNKKPPSFLPARWQEVLKNRRKREAMMFLGINAQETMTFRELLNLE